MWGPSERVARMLGPGWPCLEQFFSPSIGSSVRSSLQKHWLLGCSSILFCPMFHLQVLPAMQTRGMSSHCGNFSGLNPAACKAFYRTPLSLTIHSLKFLGLSIVKSEHTHSWIMTRAEPAMLGPTCHTPTPGPGRGLLAGPSGFWSGGSPRSWALGLEGVGEWCW